MSSQEVTPKTQVEAAVDGIPKSTKRSVKGARVTSKGPLKRKSKVVIRQEQSALFEFFFRCAGMVCIVRCVCSRG